MSQDIAFLTQQVLRHRRRWIVPMLILAIPIAVALVRMKEVPFTATIKLFAAPPNASPLAMLGGLGRGAGGISTLERDTMISGQETLALSRLVYRKVLAKLGGDDIETPPVEPTLYRQVADRISRLLFGDSYVSLRRQHIDWAYLGFKERIRFEASLDAGAFSLSYSDSDPELALLTAEHLASSLIEVNRDLLRDRTNESITLLTSKIEETRDELQKSSGKIVEFIRTKEFANNDKYVELRYEGFIKSVDREAETRVRLKAAEALLVELQRTTATLSASLKQNLGMAQSTRAEAVLQQLNRYEAAAAQYDGLVNSKERMQLTEQISKLRAELAVSTKSLSHDALLGPQVIRSLLAEAETQVQRTVAEIASSRETLKGLEAQVKKARLEISRYPELQAELSQLTVGHGQLGQVLALVTEQYYRALMQRDFDDPGLHIVESPAISPGSVSSRKSVMLVAVLSFLSAVIVLIVALREALRGTVFTRKQVEKDTTVAMALTVPRLTRVEKSDLASTFSRNETIATFGEKLRRYLRRDANGGAQVVFVSGPTAGIGKSMTSLIAGLCLNRGGVKVAILDTDYRATSRNLLELASWCENDRRAQTAADIIDQVDRHEAKPMGRPFVTKLAPRGEGNPSTVEFERQINDLVAVLRGRFDVVILDGPPITFVDSQAMADMADVAVVCVRQCRSTMGELNETISALTANAVRERPIVAIVTDCDDPSQANPPSSYRYRPTGSTRHVA